MSDHTPGPWTVSRDSSTSVCVLARRADIDHMRVVRYGCPEALDPVAICHGATETRKANARLIAAAPELLAACKSIVALCSGYKELSKELDLPLVEAAIAKAEGR